MDLFENFCLRYLSRLKDFDDDDDADKIRFDELYKKVSSSQL